ncbi:hypothetical protein BU26DRAFT_66740 [Trematosphaeria pertusa]|uniref:F-box domain-containing protein n=1 Tax=Trematosphaeria pertusa TaxID=390896 RepID=A0A6A6I453_9PLEO|nr:uncharacterized protein BU26DRAFT_66740 [Trematosphaeria pertusa]KAF2245284.1 hypothetical protein BU26DRAFT_66740 [Trematosphaeria pertusa]
MVPTLSSSNSIAFLALPLELRQQIYRFCIPENLCFTCSGNMYRQNRHEGWVEPPWRWDRTWDRYDTSGANLFFDEDDRPWHELEESVEASSTDGEDSNEDDEYEPSRLDDYCQASLRQRPAISPSPRSALPGLLLLCRQITDEVKGMLYGGNTFRVDVDDDQSNFARLFSPEAREKMRKMILVLRPMGLSYCRDFRMDQTIWDGVLGNLSILGVIAEQPAPPSPYASPQVEPEDVFKEWTAWLTPILEYLSRALSKTAQIVVDANKEEDTVHIFEKEMPGRCRFQRLRAADNIFKRGEFSWESESWVDDGPTSCRDIINDCDYDYYFSD